MNVNVNVKRKKPGRKQRRTGWTLIALGLLVAGVWGASSSLSSRRFITANWAIDVRSGVLTLEAWESEDGQLLFSYLGTEVRGVDRQARTPLFVRIPAGERGVNWLVEKRITRYFDSKGDVRLASHYRGRSPVVDVWQFVLWPIPLILWAAGVPVLRSGIVARRRANKGQCDKCGYSLAGLGVDAKCPECGRGAAGGI